VLNHKDEIPRPVRLSDFVVIFANLVHNFTQIVETFADELKEVSIYHSNRTTKINNTWEDMAKDLESLEGDK